MKWFLVVILIFVSLLGIGYKLNSDHFFDVDNIEVTLHSTNGQEIFLFPKVDSLKVDLSKHKNKSLWSIDLKEISSVLNKKDWIERYEMTRRWPTTLIVNIVPKKVEALVLSRSQKALIPVDIRGELLTEVTTTTSPDAPVLDGNDFLRQKELRQKALNFLNEIPVEGSFSRAHISEVKWNSKDGFVTRMTKSGVIVKMGEERFSLKAARVSQVLDYLTNRGVRAETIDANLSKKVLVRVREGSPNLTAE